MRVGAGELPASEVELSESGPERYVAIGRVIRPQGRHGEVLVEALTDRADRFTSLAEVYIEAEGALEPTLATVQRRWPHKGRVVLKFGGIDSISAAELLRGRYLLIRREDRMPLPPGRYYIGDLTGCRVITERQDDGGPVEIGVVSAIEQTGGVDLLHVTPSGSTALSCEAVLIPFAEAICKRIDLVGKVIVIEPPDDLLDLNT
jgi:16S rRNA processing protein RimM